MKLNSQLSHILLVSILFIGISSITSAHEHKKDSEQTYTAQDAIDNLNFSASQYSKMIANVNNKQGLLIDKQCENEPLCIPRAQDDNKIHMVHPNKWVVGFYPGALWMLLNQADNLDVLHNKQRYDAMMAHAKDYSELLFEQAN